MLIREKKDFLIFGNVLIERLSDTRIIVAAEYPINFSEQ